MIDNSSEMMFPANELYLEEALQFVENQASKFWIDGPSITRLRLLTEEIFLNIVQHGYPSGTQGKIQIICTQHFSQLSFEFVDDGIPFNPLTYKLSSVSNNLEKRPVGHVGLYLIQQMAPKNIHYTRKDNHNHLWISVDPSTKSINLR